MIRNPRSPCGERRRTDASLRSPSNFNPRSPCGERRSPICKRSSRRPHFNPRSPCGERLSSVWSAAMAASFQSTLPVWGATLGCSDHERRQMISIHAPRVGSDKRASGIRRHPRISIHAPRVGSDFGSRLQNALIVDFNPRSPCGERRRLLSKRASQRRFQSTLPVWGATG